MKTKFAYIRDSLGAPIGCVAYQYDDVAKTVRYGVSTLNKSVKKVHKQSPDKWHRPTSRLIAAGHLALEENVIHNIDAVRFRILHSVMTAIAENSQMSSTARKGARRWING